MDLDNIIFDWSGTLSNDCEAVVNSINHVFEHFGKTKIEKDTLRDNYQRDPIEFYRLFGVVADRKEIGILYKEGLSMQNKPRIIEGAKKTVIGLHKRGYDMYVISSHPDYALLNDIKRYGLSDIFPAPKVIGNSNEKSESIDGLNLDASKTAIVGDTFVDIEAGKKCGLKTIAVLGGYQSEKQLEKCNPDLIIRDIKELLNHFK